LSISHQKLIAFLLQLQLFSTHFLLHFFINALARFMFRKYTVWKLVESLRNVTLNALKIL
jgi:hypothetical protein